MPKQALEDFREIGRYPGIGGQTGSEQARGKNDLISPLAASISLKEFR
ncbi:hypothetical protein [Geoalkalibacter halelectricus]|uniref:Uncharacterized protein n=1 Tax=Geoalkalibacter halelectricus TaxID=2847045 RepID=A0ABY5ZK01_9BACT|nr:hypothetical protein [Geoalkalibacter halelectricus]MDO3378006.1 hypothetical protein [Geoalkalibacter halelectricus]UWZ78307.1 hypothetical protein L9S41_11440 [Geoalkalibacter halelectricus]